MWCVDPKKRGDVSPTIVYNRADPTKPVPYTRVQACDEKRGDFERPNDNSALVWRYDGTDTKKFEETMHRTLSSATTSSGCWS